MYESWVHTDATWRLRLNDLLANDVQEWRDYKLTWNTSEYGGVSSVSVPASRIWTPDVVLYNRCLTLFGHFLHFTIVFTVFFYFFLNLLDRLRVYE